MEGKKADKNDKTRLLSDISRGGNPVAWNDKKWLENFRALLGKTIKNKDLEHKNYLEAQIRRGASCFAITQHVNRMMRSIPFSWCPSQKQGNRGTARKLESITWIIKKLCNRSNRIWSQLVDHKEGNLSLCRKPLSIFECQRGNEECLGKITAWFSDAGDDAKIGCQASCSLPADSNDETDATNSSYDQLSPPNKKIKLDDKTPASSSSLPSLTDIVPGRSSPGQIEASFQIHGPAELWDNSEAMNSTGSSLEMQILRPPRINLKKTHHLD